MGRRKHSSMRDRARQRAKERESGGGGGSNYINLPEGMEWFQISKALDKKMKVLLDILPFEVSIDGNPEGQPKGELWYRRVFYIHRDIGPQEETVLCLSSIGESCPVCEEQARMDRDSDADEKAATALYKKKRELYNIDQGEGNPVGLWDVSVKLFGDELDKEIREGDEEVGGFADLQDGFSLDCKFKEKTLGKKTTFLEVVDIEFEKRPDLEEGVLDEVGDLDTLFNPMTYEELSALFHGGEVVPAGDEDDLPMGGDEPRGRGRGRGRGRAAEPAEKDDPPPDEPGEGDETKIECVACSGTGKSSRGRTCRACDGEGTMVDPDADDPPADPPPEEPARGRGRGGRRGRR